MGVENIYCKNCGSKNEKTAKYCEKCGQTLNSGGSNTTKVLIALVLILFIGLGALAAYVMSMDTTPVVISSTYNETQEKTQAYQPSWKLIDTYQGVSGDSRSFTTRGNKFKVSYSANPLVNYNINYLEILLIQGSQRLETGYVSWEAYDSPNTKSGTIEVSKGPGTYYLDIYAYELKDWNIEVYDYY